MCAVFVCVLHSASLSINHQSLEMSLEGKFQNLQFLECPHGAETDHLKQKILQKIKSYCKMLKRKMQFNQRYELLSVVITGPFTVP